MFGATMLSGSQQKLSLKNSPAVGGADNPAARGSAADPLGPQGRGQCCQEALKAVEAEFASYLEEFEQQAAETDNELLRLRAIVADAREKEQRLLAQSEDAGQQQGRAERELAGREQLLAKLSGTLARQLELVGGGGGGEAPGDTRRERSDSNRFSFDFDEEPSPELRGGDDDTGGAGDGRKRPKESAILAQIAELAGFKQRFEEKLAASKRKEGIAAKKLKNLCAKGVIGGGRLDDTAEEEEHSCSSTREALLPGDDGSSASDAFYGTGTPPRGGGGGGGLVLRHVTCGLLFFPSSELGDCGRIILEKRAAVLRKTL